MFCIASCVLCVVLTIGKVIVSDEISFELVTELNAEEPQFTLTCISTGGPATTVTWTRDSEEAPGKRLSVLNNATTAQYTHTLCVTGRLGGLYTCSVSNNIPSDDSTDQLLEGKQLERRCFDSIYFL